jgi:hypothetical protein
MPHPPVELNSGCLSYSDYSVYSEFYASGMKSQAKIQDRFQPLASTGEFHEPHPRADGIAGSSFFVIGRYMKEKMSFEKGKPAERLGRKATGLHSGRNRNTAAGLPGDDLTPPLPAGAEHLLTGAAPEPASLSTPSLTTLLPMLYAEASLQRDLT